MSLNINNSRRNYKAEDGTVLATHCRYAHKHFVYNCIWSLKLALIYCTNMAFSLTPVTFLTKSHVSRRKYNATTTTTTTTTTTIIIIIITITTTTTIITTTTTTTTIITTITTTTTTTIITTITTTTTTTSSYSSSSSYVGATAHCRLRPVEKCPSILSYLSPTLSIFSVPSL